jgi:hypothetical protein
LYCFGDVNKLKGEKLKHVKSLSQILSKKREVNRLEWKAVVDEKEAVEGGWITMESIC